MTSNDHGIGLTENITDAIGGLHGERLLRLLLLNPRLTGGGGGYLELSCRFSAIVSKLTARSSRNFQYLQLHQFYASCVKKKFTPLIGRP